MNNIIAKKFHDNLFKAPAVYQYDYGQNLQIYGLDLPEIYEVHFSNTPNGTSTTSVGTSEGAIIPDIYLQTSGNLYAWVFLHNENDDGETKYEVVIPILPRAEITNETPTPVQQDIITQTLAALSTSVHEVEEISTSIPTTVQNALAQAKASGEFDGRDGVDGRDGADGKDGKDGTNGKDGIDGVSPIITVSTISGGHRISLTDLQGTNVFDVPDGVNGTNGVDGHSPSVTASKSGTTTTVKIDGTTVATINDGTDGQDGHSPVISASKSDGVTTITVDGTTVAEVSDGTNGTNGTDGHTPIITASKSGTVTTISVDGTSVATISDGTNGTDGQDGHSPVVAASKSGSTTTITIDGETAATITDGTNGTNGHSPVVSASKSNGVTTIAVDGTSVATINDGTNGSDGHSPIIAASKSEGVTTITVDGETVATISDGTNGTDGHSPVVSASKSGSVTTITVDGTTIATINDGPAGHSPVVTSSKSGKVTTISVDGTSIATINDGEDGTNGTDGHSPVVTASKSGTVTTISIDGETAATINDGTNGTDGHSPVVTASKSNGVTTVSVDGTAIATINDGAKGDTGAPTDAQVATAINAIVTNPSSPPLDRTLSSSSSAVPADIGGEIKSLLDRTSQVFIGQNLANPDKFTEGYIYSNGNIASGSSYRTTDFIPVENGKSYAIGSYNAYNVIVTTRCGYLLYDSTKTPISEDYSNTDNVPGLLVAVNDANAKYMRCFTTYANGRTIMVCEASSIPTTPVAYQETVKVVAPLDTVPVTQVQALIPDEVSNALTDYEVPIIQTKQLFDRNKNTVGYCSNTGYIDSSSSYVYTEKIPVTAGKTIYFSVNGDASTARFITAYNSSGTVVSASGSSSSVSTYTVPEGITEVRFSYTNPASSSSNAKYAHFQAEYDAISGYVPYGKYFNIDGYLGKDNVLYGKKWVVCGDSFTDGVTNTTIQTGRYTGKRVVYMYLIGNRNNMDIVNFANGGQTLAFPAEPGTFTNSLTNPNGDRYYQNIPADADYITFYIGINDAGHETSETETIPLGEITDNTTATYYGAWNVVLSWLIVNRPNAHIGIIVCNGNAYKDSYRQAQIAIATKYGIPYIDLNGDARTPAMHRTSNPNIPSAIKEALLTKWRVSESDTHPNDEAHKFESTFIENFLRSI